MNASGRKTNQCHKKYENSQFVSKDIQRILSSLETSEKYNEQEAFYKKSCF